ncbi:hypothetical protein AAG906_036268 [Vitis piasezkii]
MILGFQSFINLTHFAVTPLSLRGRTLVYLKARTTGSQRLVCYSSETGSSSTLTSKKVKKESSSMSRRPNTKKGVIEENASRTQSIEIQSIRDDPAKVKAMTVQELTTTLRSVGVPAKGCKRDLVLALKSFLDNKASDESSQVEEQLEFCNENISSKRKAKNLSVEDHEQNVNIVSDASGLKQSKRRAKQSPVEAKIEVNTEIINEKEKPSIKNKEASGNKLYQGERKASSRSSIKQIAVTERIDISMNEPEPWTVLTHKKPQEGWIPYNPRTMRPPPLTGDTKFVKLMSWNVNGLRGLLKSKGFSALKLAQREDFDVLSLQETKLQEKDVEAIKQSVIEGYENSFWTCSVSKLGYSGTAIISRIKPLSVRYGLGISDHDSEGRLLTAEFESFYLLGGYVPNSGDGLKRLSYRVTQWDSALGSYMKELEKSKPVILTGDLNCAHQEIDIHDPAGNRKSAGFTDEERQSFEKNFLSKGFVDSFRKQHPGVVGYTYWGYRNGCRKSNKGWRLDYFLVSESIADKVHDSYILPDIGGSDHCPIGLVLKL